MIQEGLGILGGIFPSILNRCGTTFSQMKIRDHGQYPPLPNYTMFHYFSKKKVSKIFIIVNKMHIIFFNFHLF